MGQRPASGYQAKHTCVRLLASATLLLLAAGALGQTPESDPQQDASAGTPARSQLLFVEPPVLIAPEVDPVLPEIPQPLNPEDDPEFAARMNIINNYESEVAQLEFAGGAWEQGLVEELSSLGVLQQQQGNHLAAIAIFDRAIHVNRINSGLHTLEQIPAVEKMIESHLALGDWEKADLYFDYLFYIQQRAYGPHDPRIIPVLDRLASWNIQAFNIGYGDSLGFRLNTAQILLNAAAKMVAVHFGENDERYIRYRRNIANSSYLVSRHPELMVETQHLDFRNAEDILLSKLDARDSIQPRGYQAGEQALREIVQYYAKQDNAPLELATAMADLGDWYLMFGRRRTAEELYTEAWQILEASDNAEEWLQQLFGQVVPIPTYANSVDNLLTHPITTAEGTSLSYDYADVVFDVTVSGMVRNVEMVSEETEYNSARFSRLQREVRSSFFRPRVVNGELQRSDRNQFRYRYWY